MLARVRKYKLRQARASEKAICGSEKQFAAAKNNLRQA
jgi:hypothetical protein